MGRGMEKAGEHGGRGVPSSYDGGEGCLTVAVRIPVRIVVLLLVLPVRVVWDLLAAGARAVDRTVLRPLGRGLLWGLEWLGRALGVLGRVLVVLPLVWSYRTLVVPVGTALWWVATAVFVVPVVWVWRAVLRPLGRALDRLLVAACRSVLTPLGKALVWPVVGAWRYVVVPLVRYGVVVPSVWVWRSALVPLGAGVVWLLGRLGHGLFYCVRALWAAVVWLALVLVVAPGGWVVRRILVPAGREIAAAFSVAWRIAGYLSRAVGRALAWLLWNAVGRPGRWTYRNVCTPVGHWLRDNVLAPAARASREIRRVARETLESARETFRQTRRDAWRALVGTTRGTSRMTEPREPIEHRARTLGSTTTVPGAVPAPEISLRKQG
ncbi:hypothetical protein OG349_24615 [Streptomyces sp. NBC_01317]|uniref:hypothetical protein n=1 Tax=Streptomyces sp. NBC_01317 TaxID=2903822 RepID=UPI002E167D82|nr:hypothetical protein OG349_24615 [Streptomyces sp. NBC_01317]